MVLTKILAEASEGWYRSQNTWFALFEQYGVNGRQGKSAFNLPIPQHAAFTSVNPVITNQFKINLFFCHTIRQQPLNCINELIQKQKKT